MRRVQRLREFEVARRRATRAQHAEECDRGPLTPEEKAAYDEARARATESAWRRIQGIKETDLFDDEGGGA